MILIFFKDIDFPRVDFPLSNPGYCTALVCLGNGFPRGSVASVVAKPYCVLFSNDIRSWSLVLERSMPNIPNRKYCNSSSALSLHDSVHIYVFPLFVHFPRYTVRRIDTVLYVHTVYIYTYCSVQL